MNWDIDVGADTNPFEVRMESFVSIDLDQDVIGLDALRRIKAAGVKRQQVGLILEPGQAPPDQPAPYVVSKDGTQIGKATHLTWSYRFQKTIGYALVS